MAAHGTGGRGGRAPRRPARPGCPTQPKNAPRAAAPRPAPIGQVPAPEGSLRLGAIPGATPGKWIDTWQERMRRNPLVFVPLEVSDQRRALAHGEVDVAIVRLPIDARDLNVIPLYDETPVVVCAVDSHLTVADELTYADLAGEVLIVPADDVLQVTVPGAAVPRFAPPPTTADAIATVATGVGITIVPMSLARLHHRKDTDYRPLADGPTSAVALAWSAEDPSPLVDTFVGIVRGRSANSSRD